ncbi:MAG TPA: tetratricopeptide repeat protein [Pyrinomonadaceae bacterium]|nr:tetratricopeptide repeat protein [Pyrinomonadaceae bacterium]
MKRPIFTIRACKSFIKLSAACFLILIGAAGSSNLFAQYKGSPVKKDRLIQALRTRQLQTGDIVTIINRNGVDFELTPAVRKSLIAAGARPEVIKAVANNPRLPSRSNAAAIAKTGKNNRNRAKNPAPAGAAALSYDDLLEQAIYFYKDRKNPKGAVQILENAVKLNPSSPAAYQMLGFIYLYELNNLNAAEKSMRESFVNGGSAVFRVFHDDNGKFTGRCTGSLYISQDNLRFESDENVHTFETPTLNIDKIKLDTETTSTWKKHSIFKIFLKIGKAEAKFRFAPLTGVQEESKMVERFIAASNSNANSTVSD